MQVVKSVCIASALAVLAASPALAKDKSENTATARTQQLAQERDRPSGQKPRHPENVDPAHDDLGSDARRSKEPWLHVDVRFSNREREIICEHVRCEQEAPTPVTYRKKTKSKPLPPGLAKKVERGGQLPPGWQKKVVVGQRLEREVYCQAKPLPPEVAVKLPPPPKGTAVIVVQGKVVRLIEATLEILDVFDINPLQRGG